MPAIGSYLQKGNGQPDLRSYAHASRLYVDRVFALAPKTSWIYYVVFNINPDAITDSGWGNRKKINEVGMLVKSVDLPRFQVSIETINQYNRKTVIQKSLNYQPSTFMFHDDHSNTVHNMWLNYYRYYFTDSTYGGTGPIGTARDNTPGAYLNTKYEPANDLATTTGYGLNSPLVVDPFFNSITIYQLNKQVFTSFQLVNPLVSNWEHDHLDQAAGEKFAESRMMVNYEAVFYNTGRVEVDNPPGFATLHYDHTPSPLGVGGTTNSASDIFGDVSGDVPTGASPLDVLNAVLNPTNFLSNAIGVTQTPNNGYSILDNVIPSYGSGGLNGLGVNLNLNLGNNYLTAGQSLASQISILTGNGAGQENVNGTTTQSALPNGIAPEVETPPISIPDISGSSTLQTEPDSSSDDPSPESNYYTDIA
jgi:hypothetical protein